MPGDREQGTVKTEIPEDVIADAVAAVDRHPPSVDVTVEEPGDGSSAPVEGGDADRELAAQAEELRAALAEEHDLRLRALADLDNFRKRVAREREQAQRYGGEELLRDLLPVLDNMDRALAALPEGPLATGVSMTQRQLEETLKRHGLKPFQAAPGAPFDPNVHEAVHTVATSDHPPGTIAAQQLRGYFLHDRLLRPAMVVVASAPPDTEREPP